MVLEDVSLSFDSRSLRGVRNINLTINQSEIFGIIGPSGAGKSTIIKLISGELEPTSGRIHRPTSIAQLGREDTYPSFVTLQHWLEGAQSAELDPAQRTQSARDVADALELTQELPRALSSLSQGQWQRARLAQALVIAPEILLLDEPFVHLDPVLRAETLAALMQLLARRATSVVWVGHEVQEMMAYAHRIAVLNFGTIEQLASPQELFRHPKNLSVARLIGHKNFLTYRRQMSHWQGIFGNYFRPIDSTRGQVILSLSPRAFKIDAQGPYSAILKTRHFFGFTEELEVSTGDQTFYVEHAGLLEARIGEKLHFRVCLDDAVVIDCL